MTVAELDARVGILGSCGFWSGKGLGTRAEFKVDKVNVPVLRRDLSRIKVSALAWERAHKDSVRALQDVMARHFQDEE
eukprot:1141775-Pelagomonas_calceolata.AAC.2